MIMVYNPSIYVFRALLSTMHMYLSRACADVDNEFADLSRAGAAKEERIVQGALLKLFKRIAHGMHSAFRVHDTSMSGYLVNPPAKAGFTFTLGDQVWACQDEQTLRLHQDLHLSYRSHLCMAMVCLSDGHQWGSLKISLCTPRCCGRPSFGWRR